MGPARRFDDPQTVGYAFGNFTGVPVRCPEAFDYDDDVATEVVAQIQAEANQALDEGDWVVIDGYVGSK